MITHAYTANVRKFCLSSLAVLSLSGCGYFSDDWEMVDGRCQAVSSDGERVAIVTRDIVGFMDMAKSCPANLSYLDSDAVDIDVNGQLYPPALQICNQDTGMHNMVLVGATLNSSPDVAASVIKAFTGMFGAKIEIDGKTSRFYKSNFLDACKAVLPQRPSSPQTPRTANDFLGIQPKTLSGHSVGSKQQELAAQQEKAMLDAGYEKHNGEWRKKWRTPVTSEQTNKEPAEDLTFGRKGNVGDITFSRPEETKSPVEPASTVVPRELSDLTEEQEDKALERAKATYLLSSPQSDLSQFVWERYPYPDKNREGKILGTLHYITTDPVSHQTVDIDVEIEKDGTPGYALYKARPETTEASSAPQTDSASQDTLWPVNAFCTLDNGKNIGTYAFPGQDYSYTYTSKDDKAELELTEGLFGVKAFHYSTPFGMGAANYLRFNKGEYDYVLINKDNGRDQEFQGIRVYKNGQLIASHACKTPLDLDLRAFPQDSHFDSEKMGDYFTTN